MYMNVYLNFALTGMKLPHYFGHSSNEHRRPSKKRSKSGKGKNGSGDSGDRCGSGCGGKHRSSNGQPRSQGARPASDLDEARAKMIYGELVYSRVLGT